MDKNFTSAWIKTRRSFTPNGRVDIRAALPEGKLLSPWAKLVPPKHKGIDERVKRNQVFTFGLCRVIITKMI